MAYGKVVPVEDAVAVIRPGDTVATSGFVGVGTPGRGDRGARSPLRRVQDPPDLTLVFAAAPGGRARA